MPVRAGVACDDQAYHHCPQRSEAEDGSGEYGMPGECQHHATDDQAQGCKEVATPAPPEVVGEAPINLETAPALAHNSKVRVTRKRQR